MLKKLIKLLNKYKRLVKFGIAGVTATAAHFTILTTLTEVFGVHYLASATAGYLVAFWVSFLLQKFWTFRDKSRERFAKQVGYYFILLMTGVSLNALGMYALVDGLGIFYLYAQLGMSAAIAILNYLVNKYFIFAKAVAEHETKSEGRTVLIATPIFPPVIGGPATYVKTLCDELPKHGYIVKVVTYGAVKEFSIFNFQFSNNVSIFNVSKDQNLLMKYIKYFMVIWKEAPKSDIVFLQDPVNSGWPAGLACYLRAKPYIIKVVGDYAWEHAQECHGVTSSLDEFQKQAYGGKIGIVRRIQRWVVHNAETVITPSGYLKGIITGWGISGDKIKVIYNSVKEASVSLGKEECRAKHGIKGWTLVSVGRLLPWKGFNVLIDLVPVIASEAKQSRESRNNDGIASASGPRNDIRLLIIGDGPERAKVEQRITASPARDRITFIPGLPQAELWEYIKASDTFILNTGYEGLPHIVIEAQMLGTPVITTAAGGNREVVTDGVNGLIVRHDDKESIKASVLKLYNDAGLVQRLAEGGKQGLGKFGREKMMNELIDLFVIAKSRATKQSRG